MNTECTLSNDELIEKCNEWVSKLAKSGGRDWRLHVPVNFNTDPDMLFCELANRFKKLLEPVPSITEAGGWMNVEAGLPDKRTDYLVYNPNGFGNKIDIARFDTYNKTWFQFSDCIHPTHWALLPSSPQSINQQ